MTATACGHPQPRPAPISIPIASSSLVSEVGQGGEKTEPAPVSAGEKLEPPVTATRTEEVAERPEAAKPVATGEAAKSGAKDSSETRGPLVTDTGAPPPAVASVPDRPARASAPQLKPGAIKMIQQRLAIAGALPEVQTSGAMDPPTRAALLRYQQANGLPATGEPDDATVKKLGLRSESIFEP